MGHLTSQGHREGESWARVWPHAVHLWDPLCLLLYLCAEEGNLLKCLVPMMFYFFLGVTGWPPIRSWSAMTAIRGSLLRMDLETWWVPSNHALGIWLSGLSRESSGHPASVCTWMLADSVPTQTTIQSDGWWPPFPCPDAQNHVVHVQGSCKSQSCCDVVSSVGHRSALEDQWHVGYVGARMAVQL